MYMLVTNVEKFLKSLKIMLFLGSIHFMSTKRSTTPICTRLSSLYKKIKNKKNKKRKKLPKLKPFANLLEVRVNCAAIK